MPLSRDLANTKFIDEGRSFTDNTPRTRDSLQLTKYTLQESNQQHESDREIGIEWLKHTANESHVSYLFYAATC